jgi:hypothetical protein
MPDQVKVDDIEVFGRFRVAMLKFAHAAANALSSADSDIARTHSWLESEQRTFWEGQLRKRMEAVTKARETLRQKKLYKDASGRNPGVTEEEKALARCIAAVQQAEERIDSIRKWLPRLEKAAGHYRGGVAALSKSVNDDIPKAVALLDRLAASLEQYVEIEAASGAAEAGEASVAESQMARGGEGESVPTIVQAESVPPAIAADESSSAPAVPPTEGSDVVDGQ